MAFVAFVTVVTCVDFVSVVEWARRDSNRPDAGELHMKKLRSGCLVTVVLAAVVLAAGSYFLYRAATPYVEDARNYLRGLSELSEIDKGIANTAPHQPPVSGELTQAQVERFAREQ